jgi:cholesterol transport system auxiliary component
MTFSYFLNALKPIGTLLLFILLGGCSILSTKPSPQTYLLPMARLSSAEFTTPYKRPANWSLRIIEPNVSQFLNSARIAVQPQVSESEIAVYKDVRWSDPTPILFRNRIIQEFRTSGRVRAVGSEDDRFQADYELSGDLTHFQTIYRSATECEVLIRFDAHLTNVQTKRIFASRAFEVRQPVKGTSINEAVNAFGLANDQVAEQLLNWTTQQVGAY